MVVCMDEPADLWCLEWDFLAVDPAGHVAVLSCGGYGPIPQSALAARESVEQAIAMISTLPTTTEAVSVVEGDGDYSDWFAMSARGFYAYDWQAWNGPYERISAPASPLSISSLPDEVRAAATILQIPQQFAESTQLNPPS